MSIAEMSSDRLTKENPSSEQIHTFMENMLKLARESRPEVVAMVVAYEPKGNEIDDQMYLARIINQRKEVIKGKNYRQKTWYSDCFKSQKGCWREPFIGDFIQGPIAIYTTPFYRVDSENVPHIAGVLCIDISLEFLRIELNKIPIKDGGYPFIISNTGTIVSHPKQEWVFTETLSSLAKKTDSVLAKLDEAIRRQKKGVILSSSYKDDQAYTYFTPMKIVDWTFGIVFPAKQFFAYQERFDKIFLVIGVSGFLLMLLVVVLVTRRISNPLNELSVAAREIGKGNLNCKIPNISSKDELGLFASAFKRMTTDLKQHIKNLQSVTAAKKKIESELKVAQEIQEGILPQILPPFPECEYFEIDASLVPAKEVGGDLYDFFMLSPTKICAVIGDVSGKGVPASLFMAVTQTLHRGMTHDENIDTSLLVKNMNASLCVNNKAFLFVTYLFAVFDFETHTMTYTNAGHDPFYLLKKEGSFHEPCQLNGIPLGIQEDAVYTQSEIKFESGDTFYFYTDGVPEAKNKNEEFYGMDRLKSLLTHCAQEQCSPMAIDKAVKDSVHQFVDGAEQFDDITMLCIKIR